MEEDSPDVVSEMRPAASQPALKRMLSQTRSGALEDKDESELMFTTNYEDYVDQLLQKLDLLMDLDHPWDLNENEEEKESDAALVEGQQKIVASLKKNNAVIVEEKGVIPESKEELICTCVMKYLLKNNTVSPAHLRESLQHRTENAKNKQRIFEEGLQFLRMIHDFPQASRLFLLGMFHEMTVFSNLYIGGFHNSKRHREGSYGIDYLENCEGASQSVMKRLIHSLVDFCNYLKVEFTHCVDTLHWRLGGAIMWFITTVASPKFPYFARHLNLLPFLEDCSNRLSKAYEMRNDYSKDILISPGIFWDSLSQKPISLSESHFRYLLIRLREEGSPINTNTTKIPGIFPVSVMALANCMRLAYSITLIQQFSDYVSHSRVSPAQNNDTLYNWTLTDVSNLFVRQSTVYLQYTQQLFDRFMGYFGHMQRVLHDRCKGWRPFAYISYRSDDTTVNMYTCVKVVDEKNIMRGMIATDMLISAAEGVLSSYLALILFIIKTRTALVLPWKKYATVFWNMLFFSPRHQKLAAMILQYIIPNTDYIPPVFEENERRFEGMEGSPEAESILKNPLLNHPVFPADQPTTEAKREAFIYYLLHLASHSDACPGALVGERSSCALCCNFFPFIYNTISHASPCFRLPNKEAFIEELLTTHQKVFISTCKMHIRPDGHTAAFCSLVFAEEMVYLLRLMMGKPAWHDLMNRVFSDIFQYAVSALEKERNVTALEKENPKKDSTSLQGGFHVVLRQRSPWFCLLTAVLKVLGAITPRMYAGCRIRIHEFLMEGENEVSTLIRTAYQSHGTGSIIKYHRSMGEALVLLDKIDTPRYINNYVFDVVDRIEPPDDDDATFGVFLDSIVKIVLSLSLREELFTLPSSDMPFFNTSDLTLTPSELQNIILYLYCVRCINHMMIRNDSLTHALSPALLQQLIRTAMRPLPCNVSFNTLIIRQYYNWFIEYLIDTYAGAARLLPMELQREEEGDQHHGHDRITSSFGLGKEEEEDVPYEDDVSQLKIVRNEKRMKMAKGLSSICSIDVSTMYTVLQAFNDNESEALNYLVEQPPDVIAALSSPIQIDAHLSTCSDSSVLADMELGIRQLQILPSATEQAITEESLSLVIPPFTRLQKLTAENMKHMNSIYGVVASITDKSVIYAPIPETGVITAVSSSGVTLSMLNADSGILEENVYPPSSISLHKYRLLYYLSNVPLFRGVTGRICCTLAMKYVRELLICLLYYSHKNHIDVMTAWPMEPWEVVRLTQYTYTTYLNNLILNPSKQNHVTLVSCLFRILKGSIKSMVIDSPRGSELLDALMKGVWTEAPLTSSQYKKRQSSRSAKLKRSREEPNCVVSSMHPSFSKAKFYDQLVVKGVEGLRVVFDKRCCLDADNASLTFFRDENHAEVIARFTGDSSNFAPFTIRGNTLRYLFESTNKAKPTWGFAFTVQPFQNVRWNGDGDVIDASCFDWDCFALKLIMDVSRSSDVKNVAYFSAAMKNLILYLRSSDMPFKSRVVELLIRLHSLGSACIGPLPDVT